jgi:multidrug efflux system membrane fusion protein
LKISSKNSVKAQPSYNVQTKPVAAGLLLVLTFALFFLQGCSSTGTAEAPTKGKGGKGGGGGPVPVVTAKVGQKDVPIEVAVVGNVEAYSTISVKAQVGGEITKVFFKEGDYVKKGAPLFTIDSRPLEAALAQVKANLAKDEALLAQAKANLARDIAQEQYARTESGRYNKLASEGIVSKDQGEQFKSNADALEQSVVADRAAIESAKAQAIADQANIANAEVQLGYTSIKSPIDGRTGNVTVKQGNVVPPNTTELVTINQIEPIYATFAVPESKLNDVKKYMAGGKVQVMAKLQDATGTETGMLTFIDNNVDMTTGTIKLKGTFDNHDRKLWPGQFINVVVRLAMQPNAIVVPNQAVQTGQDGAFVYVVKEDRSVEARPVVAGVRVDQDLVIDKGLEVGETIVTEGQLRLAPGIKVQMRGQNGDKQGGADGEKGDGKKGDGKRRDRSTPPG